MNRRKLLTGLMGLVGGLTALLGVRRAAAGPQAAKTLPKPDLTPAELLGPHTCRTVPGNLPSEVKDRLYAQLIERHIHTPDGRVRLLQSTRVLGNSPHYGCRRCEAHTQQLIQLILNSLRGDEMDRHDLVTGKLYVVKDMVDHLKGIQASRQQKMARHVRVFNKYRRVRNEQYVPWPTRF